MRAIVALVLAVLGAPAFQALGQDAVVKLYGDHCSACHGAGRLGGTGPALLPDNLERLRPAAATEVIAKGRHATQMPAFSDKLTAPDIQGLVNYIFTRPAVAPAWGLEEIAASRVVHTAARTDSDRPVHAADPMNLFVVVETGDHHATILDGDRLEPIARFPTRFALHGGPKFSPDGRFVYFASRDGWISKYDLHRLRMVAEVRAGINTRNAAVSSDGRYVMVANYLPHTLVALDARDLAPLKVIPVMDVHGKSSRVSAVYDAAPRESFIAALKDVKEIWEMPYGANAEPVYKGLVHDYKMKEGIAETGPFPVRQIQIDDYMDDFFFDRGYANVVGAARDAKNGQVVNLHVKRRIESIELPGLPHLGSGITWDWQGTTVLATPNLKEPQVTVIDTRTWKTIRQIPTLGPGFFLRSHENTPYAWVDAFNSAHQDSIQVIDKRTLEVVRTLRPAPGRKTAHVEFSADGRYAILSVWEMEGEIIVYDAATLEVVKRLPMNKPSGKYNVHNKITRSDGTSH
ncbi:MAG: c-type cytochrome [Betaproteobacteria bacterium]|nr:c-type cytochrome [Betaproteobacteria bacterium]